MFRGIGWQTRVACVNFVSMWLVCLPLGGYLAFVAGLGLTGLWLGLLGAFGIAAAIFLALSCCINWRREVQRAVDIAERAKRPDADAGEDEREAERTGGSLNG